MININAFILMGNLIFCFTVLSAQSIKVPSKESLLETTIKNHNIQAIAQLLYTQDYKKEFKELTPTIPIEELHLIREMYQRLPDPSFKKIHPTLPESSTYLTELQQNGFVKISGLLSTSQIEQLKKDFNVFLDDAHQRQNKKQSLGKNHQEFYWRDDENTCISNNPFKYSTELIKICCHPIITETIYCYLGKVGFIHKGSATHYKAGGKKGKGVFNWHHDAAGKRVKLMILLSDTDQDCRCTTYVAGSHVIVHTYDHYQKNMVDPNYCLNFIPEIPIAKFTGNQGDIYLFDTNGVHSGNVAPKGRDAFIISYSSDLGHVRPYNINEDIFKSCHLIDRNPFDLMLKIQRDPHFKVHKATNWIESLTNPDTWLMDKEI